MQTHFTPQQLDEPAIAEANRILRSCVHCGFCLATCPTYQLLGDELDSPRGRIYLIKAMLESDQQPQECVVKHIDRCLSCLSCMTTCPSGVNYMHLIDHARAHIEQRRPLLERLLRGVLARVLPNPTLVKFAIFLAASSRWLHRFLPQRLRGMAALSRSRHIMREDQESKQGTAPTRKAVTESRGSVGLLLGCVQQAMDDGIHRATIRLLGKLGYAVVELTDTPCCGAIELHLGSDERARKRIAANVKNWRQVIAQHRLEAIIVNASGCGTTIKDYGYLLQGDDLLKEEADRVSNMTLDITEFLVRCDLSGLRRRSHIDQTVAYLNPCSMQHGQKISEQPLRLLEQFGFNVKTIPEGHLCCGSAGTYNMLQPELARELGERKAENILAVKPDIIATGNLGCILQMRQYLDLPIRHTVELLDWASDE